MSEMGPHGPKDCILGHIRFSRKTSQSTCIIYSSIFILENISSNTFLNSTYEEGRRVPASLCLFLKFHRRFVNLYLKEKLLDSPSSCLNQRSFFVWNHVDWSWNGFIHIILLMLSYVLCYIFVLGYSVRHPKIKPWGFQH